MDQTTKTETKQTQALIPAAQTQAVQQHEGTINAFGDVASFETAARMAAALAMSTMVPQQYQGNRPNCMIAIELASRIHASVFAVMQHLNIVKGKPSWSATFLIATVNQSGRFTPLRFTFLGEKGKPGWGCYAKATDKETGEELIGSTITLEMAKAENWGPKWQTMPEQMLRYRAASFWTRVYAPEAGLGMQTAEELEDLRPVQQFQGSVVLTPGADPADAVEGVDEVAAYAAKIAAAATIADLKALSKEIARLPAEIGEQLQAPYTARRRELTQPTPAAPPSKPAEEPPHNPETGEVREPGQEG